MKIITILIVTSILSGCVGTFVPMLTAENSGAGSIKTASNMPVVLAAQVGALKNLGEVKGYSCKNKLWDADATAEAATLQAKIAATQLGATSISNLSCAAGGTSVVTNCWSSVTCTAMALQ